MQPIRSLLLATCAAAFALAAVPARADPGHAHGAGTAHAASPAGKPGDPAKVTRTVNVTMNDAMRFVPESFDAKAGETVRFFVRNEGKVNHEFVVGTEQEVRDHAEMMKQMPGMQHADAGMITLKPGQRGAVVWTFDQPGTYVFACTVPGHLESGMRGQLVVQ